MCERDDLFIVFFGAVINGKIEDSCQNLWGKLVCWSALVQKVCYTLRRGLQQLVQFLDLQWVGWRVNSKEETQAYDGCVAQTIPLTGCCGLVGSSPNAW